MDPSTYLKELSNSLFKYQQNNFLCDVFIVTPENVEVPAHSVIMSAVSVKLKAAFEKSDNSIKKNYVFKLYVSDCDVTTIEIVLQFVYTGTICLPNDTTLDISRVLAAGQKLGLNPEKIAGCMAALLSLTDSSVYTNLPPLILTDEDICLEIVEKGLGSAKFHGGSRATASEIIRVTSRVDVVKLSSGHKRDHSYTQDSVNPEVLQHLQSRENLGTGNTGDMFEVPPDQMDTLKAATLSDSDEGSDGNDEIEPESTASGTAMESLDPDLCTEISTMLSAGNIKSEELQITYIKDEDILQVVQQQQQDTMMGAPAEYPLEELGDQYNAGPSRNCSDHKVSTVGKRKGRTVGFGPAIKEKVIHFCDICGKSFSRNKEYTEHRRCHTGEKPFNCDICGKGFSRMRSVSEHRRLHTGERPFVCDICAKQFFTSGELIKHRRYHSWEKPYRCDECGKEFLRCGEHADHKRVHAGENACPLCGKEFTRLHNMKEHVNSAHTGTKHYVCTVCGKQFAYSSGLRYHRRLHKVERPFKCDVCSKCFARMGELSRHERNAHKQQVVQIQLYHAPADMV